jgi:hypothetical protein
MTFTFRKFNVIGPIITTEDKAGTWVKAFLIDPEEREPLTVTDKLNKDTDPRIIADFQEFIPFGSTHDVLVEEAKTRAIDWMDYMGSRLAEPNPENTRKGIEIDEQDPLLAALEANHEEDEILYYSPPIVGRVVTHLVVPSYGPGYPSH